MVWLTSTALIRQKKIFMIVAMNGEVESYFCSASFLFLIPIRKHFMILQLFHLT